MPNPNLKKYRVTFHEIRKVTMEVELDFADQTDWKDPPEEVAITSALEGNGLEIDSEWIKIIEYGEGAPGKEMLPTAEEKKR